MYLYIQKKKKKEQYRINYTDTSFFWETRLVTPYFGK